MKKNKAMKKIISIIIVVTMMISLVSTSLAVTTEKSNSVTQQPTLKDIGTHWAGATILNLISRGVVNGYSDGTFKPDSDIYVDAFIKMVVTSLGYKLDNGPEYWASTYISKAKELGIVKEGEFSNYTKPINREQMATMIVRALNEEYPADLEQYKAFITDYNNIEDTYKEDILKAVCKGIITGYQDGSFGGYKNATRAEASVVIVRMLDKNERKLPGSTSTIETPSVSSTLTYKIVDTNQTTYYNDSVALTSAPSTGADFYGQDAQYNGNQKSYTLSADTKTVYDNVTGLTWQSSPNMTNTTPVYADKKSYIDAQSVPATLNAAAYGGFTDWRLPTLKEMYSLILFSGIDCSGLPNTYSDTSSLTPFIDTKYFKFSYGDAVLDGRILESQYYTTTTFINNPGDRGFQKQFGVNFADGRIKGYDIKDPSGKYFKFFVQCVRGNTSYGINNYADNGDNTITDNATGLMWAKSDSSTGMSWKDALAWVQKKNAENYLGHSDWRMPNAKELESIVDYGNAPEYNGKPAINTDYFNTTSFTNEEGEKDYPYFWASTTHVTYNQSVSSVHAKYGTYVAFGRSLGYSSPTLIDVHGAGVQKSDPKNTSYLSTSKDATVNGVTFKYWGPQGDVVRAMNYVRLVRDAN